MAAKRTELRVKIRALDPPDHLVERPFKSLQDGYDKKRVEHHR